MPMHASVIVRRREDPQRVKPRLGGASWLRRFLSSSHTCVLCDFVTPTPISRWEPHGGGVAMGCVVRIWFRFCRRDF